MTLSVSKMNISNSGVFQAKTLEVDESLFDKSLRIIDSGGPSSGMVNNPACFDEKKTLFPEQDLPSVAVVMVYALLCYTTEEHTPPIDQISCLKNADIFNLNFDLFLFLMV